MGSRHRIARRNVWARPEGVGGPSRWAWRGADPARLGDRPHRDLRLYRSIGALAVHGSALPPCHGQVRAAARWMTRVRSRASTFRPTRAIWRPTSSLPMVRPGPPTCPRARDSPTSRSSGEEQRLLGRAPSTGSALSSTSPPAPSRDASTGCAAMSSTSSTAMSPGFATRSFPSATLRHQCLPMGAWATGTNTGIAMAKIAMVKNTGPDLDKIIDTIEHFGPPSQPLSPPTHPSSRTRADRLDAQRFDWDAHRDVWPRRRRG